MSINVSGVWINCHFFSRDEIEFDLNPAEISESAKLAAMFDCMSGLANVLDKDVVMTPENMREIVTFRCRPRTNSVEHTPFGGYS